MVEERDMYVYNELNRVYPDIIDAYDKCKELEQKILSVKSSKVLNSDYQDELKTTEREFFSFRQRINSRDYDALKMLDPRRTSSFDYYEKALSAYCSKHGEDPVTEDGLSEIHTAAETLKEYLANMQMSLNKGQYNEFENPLEVLERCGVTMSEKSIYLLTEGFIDRNVAFEAKLASLSDAGRSSTWKVLSDDSFIENCDHEKLDENKMFDRAVYQRAFELNLDWGTKEELTIESKRENFSNAVFEGITIRDSVFSLDNMTYINLDDAAIQNVSFDRTDLTATSMVDTKIENVNMYSCNMINCDAMSTVQEGVNYTGCDLTNVDFSYSTLGTEERPVIFDFGTDLSNVSFERADLTHAKFEDVKNIHTVNFDGAKMSPELEKLLEEVREKATKVKYKSLDELKFKVKGYGFGSINNRATISTYENDGVYLEYTENAYGQRGYTAATIDGKRLGKWGNTYTDAYPYDKFSHQFIELSPADEQKILDRINKSENRTEDDVSLKNEKDNSLSQSSQKRRA